MSKPVHRLVEEWAAATPEAIAIVDGARVTTYRELNLRANALARRLCACGLTRGAVVIVRMPRGTDLALLLLAVLKAGASYAWEDVSSEAGDPRACVIRHASSGGTPIEIDIERELRDSTARVGPNLPVVTRGADVACLLPDGTGRPTVLVPHASIASLPRVRAGRHSWTGSAGALDLWAALMSGATLAIGIGSPATAAA